MRSRSCKRYFRWWCCLRRLRRWRWEIPVVRHLYDGFVQGSDCSIGRLTTFFLSRCVANTVGRELTDSKWKWENKSVRGKFVDKIIFDCTPRVSHMHWNWKFSTYNQSHWVKLFPGQESESINKSTAGRWRWIWRHWRLPVYSKDRVSEALQILDFTITGKSKVNHISIHE